LLKAQDDFAALLLARVGDYGEMGGAEFLPLGLRSVELPSEQGANQQKKSGRGRETSMETATSHGMPDGHGDEEMLPRGGGKAGGTIPRLGCGVDGARPKRMTFA
jgi:hypothetical protein